MSLQEPGPGEGLPAGLAPARQRVRADVHLECGERSVALSAVLAGEAAGNLVVAVQLLVLGEAGLGGEGLSALAAAVGLVGAGLCAAAVPPCADLLLLLLLLLLKSRMGEIASRVL